MSTLNLYDSETHNPLCGRVSNIDYAYQAEQWVQDTARDKQDPKNPWLVRWELVSSDAVLAIWTRPNGDTGLPRLTYAHPTFSGTWTREPHKVYVAGTRHEANTNIVVGHLRAHNIPVTSTWHDNPPGDTNPTPENRRTTAMTNYAAMDAASLIVVVPCPTHHLRGAHTEVGYAIGKNKPVVVVGVSGDLNTMTEHPNITYCTLDNLTMAIARR